MRFFEQKIISIEKIFENKNKVVLNNKKLELFLNGVKLNSTLEDGICKIYNDKDIFLGIGIVKENKLKRDVII